MKFCKIIQKELDSLNVPYEIKNGSKHHKIFVNGVFCGIMPLNGVCENDKRGSLNIRSQIRRAAKENEGRIS